MISFVPDYVEFLCAKNRIREFWLVWWVETLTGMLYDGCVNVPSSWMFFRDHQRKRNTLKALKRKALDKNPDEFYFKMVNTRMEVSTKNQTFLVNHSGVNSEERDLSWFSPQKELCSAFALKKGAPTRVPNWERYIFRFKEFYQNFSQKIGTLTGILTLIGSEKEDCFMNRQRPNFWHCILVHKSAMNDMVFSLPRTSTPRYTHTRMQMFLSVLEWEAAMSLGSIGSSRFLHNSFASCQSWGLLIALTLKNRFPYISGNFPLSCGLHAAWSYLVGPLRTS